MQQGYDQGLWVRSMQDQICERKELTDKQALVVETLESASSIMPMQVAWGTKVKQEGAEHTGDNYVLG